LLTKLYPFVNAVTSSMGIEWKCICFEGGWE
jgi:hypothetical protein